MANKNKKLTRRQRRDRGIERPGGTSKYALKKAKQAKGIFSDTSPFRLVGSPPKTSKENVPADTV